MTNIKKVVGQFDKIVKEESKKNSLIIRKIL